MGGTDYIAFLRTALRVPLECSPRLVWKFIYNFGWRNVKNMAAFERRQATGQPFFPAFVMISVTERCNLACSGCWVSAGGQRSLSLAQLDGIITESKKRGSYFFGILGGEPLLYKGLFDLLGKHGDCYFQLFTNGTLLTGEIARWMRQCGNITPLLSIEGLEEESDRRRGKSEVFNRTMRGVEACRKERLIFGVAASICQSNYDELLSRDYINRVARAGAHYLWYYIYRPVGADPHPENALTKEQIRGFRRFVVEQRRDAPLFLIETYWDADGRALCPAATGMSHHISPSGALEFCPPLQMAKEFIDGTGANVGELFESSAFLADLRRMVADTSRGCILLENPAKLVSYLESRRATDTTSRRTVLGEYRRMTALPGHDMPGEEIPERNLFYRILKKRYFFGFGAYG